MDGDLKQLLTDVRDYLDDVKPLLEDLLSPDEDHPASALVERLDAALGFEMPETPATESEEE